MKSEQQFENYIRLERWTKSTFDQYMSQLRKYIGFCYSEGLLPEEMPKEGIIKFISESRSTSTSNQRRAVMIKLYDKVLNNPAVIDGLPYAKKRKKLPESLTPSQVSNIFHSVKNPKHRLILKTIYALGLRISELINIKLVDFREKVNIETEERYFELIVIGKGIKDRRIAIPEELMNEVILYCSTYKPKDYLFPGQLKRNYSTTSIRNIFNRAKKECDIKVTGSVHILRKSRATHLLNTNANNRMVKQMFGWNSDKTIDHYHQADTSAQYDIISQIDKKIKKTSNLLFDRLPVTTSTSSYKIRDTEIV